MIWILSFIEGLFLLKHFRLYSTIFFLSIGLICGCSYEPLAPPEMPTYYQTINLPLADVSLPLADLVNPDNNIYGDSTKDQLYFQFSGNLDTVTLTENIFQIPAVGNVNFSQNFSELSESQLTFSRSVTQTTKLSEIITIPGILPSPNDLLIGEIARYELDDQRYKYR
nr:hypothetical protein [Candidatus Neomarinimicrobiota bacterium]